MDRTIIMTTAYDAAEKLGIDSVTIYRRLEKKQMAAVKDGARWKVFLVEIISKPGTKPMYVSLPFDALHTILGAETADAITKGE